MVHIDKKQYHRDWAENMAIIYLTRRDDLHIERKSNSPYNLSLQAYVLDTKLKNKPVIGSFGIVVDGAMYSKEFSSTLSSLKTDLDLYSSLDFPVFLFCFSMKSNDGHYLWINKTSFTEEANDKLELKPLTNEEIEDIVNSTKNINLRVS